jgi:hypothetical protein
MKKLETDLVKYFNFDLRHGKDRDSPNYRTYTCRIPGCNYECFLTLIGIVCELIRPQIMISDEHNYFTIEFYKTKPNHSELDSRVKIQPGLKGVCHVH